MSNKGYLLTNCLYQSFLFNLLGIRPTFNEHSVSRSMKLCCLYARMKTGFYLLLIMSSLFLLICEGKYWDGPLEKLWGGRGIFELQEFFFVIKFLV